MIVHTRREFLTALAVLSATAAFAPLPLEAEVTPVINWVEGKIIELEMEQGLIRGFIDYEEVTESPILMQRLAAFMSYDAVAGRVVVNGFPPMPVADLDSNKGIVLTCFVTQVQDTYQIDDAYIFEMVSNRPPIQVV